MNDHEESEMTDIAVEPAASENHRAPAPRQKFCPVLVDGEEYHFDHSPVTGGEIMDAAGIPHSVGLLRILPDGTQETVGVDEEIKLRRRNRGAKPCHQFLKRVRFKRG